MNGVERRPVVWWRWAAWSVAILVGIVALAFVAVFSQWLRVAGVQAGSDAVLRFVRFGSTTIDDFKRYPSRRLAASPTPYRFAENAGGGRLS